MNIETMNIETMNVGTMNVEEISRDSGARTNAIAVSGSAKRQIAAEVLESQAHLSGTRLGPSFLDGFDDGPAGID
jgi:hypothetical protein